MQTAAGERPGKASFLILQGLGTPFFAELAKRLGADGSPVHKVNFSGGDRWFSKNAVLHRFNRKPAALEPYYRSLIETHRITDILLFGDCRPIHKTARKVAQDLGIRVWVFEEGYTRPCFVTCEEGGTNDLSLLPRDAGAIRALAKTLADQDLTCPDLPDPMPRRVRMELARHLWNILLWPLYFRNKGHRPETVSAELKGWFTRFRRKLRHSNLNATLIKRYEQRSARFFMVPLQLNSDYQIREHSDYASVLDFIRETVASFARNAPKKTLLLFKGHPLDNGMIDYRSYIALAAMQNGVEGRVDYVEGGDLDVFLKRAEGIVLINSTVGYAALRKAKPVKALGRALYDMPGLTAQMSLDKFWKSPPGPDVSLIGDFLKVIRAKSQIPGDFFTEPGIKMAANAAAGRIKKAPSDTKTITREQPSAEKEAADVPA